MAFLGGSDLVITGQATQTAAGNNIVLATAGTGSTDVTGYRTVAIQIIVTGTVSSGVVTFEASNDGTTFVALPLYDEASLTANPISTVSPATGVNRFFLGPIHWKFFRARISTVIGGGGSIAAITVFSAAGYQPDIYTIIQATAANLNTTAVIASGTVTAVTNLNGGQTAHSAASTGNPLRVGGRVAPTTIATVDTTLAAGEASEIALTTAMQQVTKPFSPSELDITLPILPSVTTTTPQVIIPASGTANVRNYITGLTIQTDTLGAAGSVFVIDGQGAIGTSVTIATPGVFTSSTHDLRVGDAIIFTWNNYRYQCKYNLLCYSHLFCYHNLYSSNYTWWYCNTDHRFELSIHILQSVLHDTSSNNSYSVTNTIEIRYTFKRNG